MVHVSGHAFGIESRELAADGDTLVHLPHLRQLEIRTKLRLAHEDDLKKLLPAFQLREYANFFEERQGQILRLVDDEYRKRLQRHQRIEELVKRIAQVGSRRAIQTTAFQIADGNHAEVHQQHLQKIFARDERIGDKGGKGAAVKLLEYRPAEGRLPGADLSREHNQTFPATDPGEELVEGRGMRRALEQKSRIRRQAERLLAQSVERFVCERCGWTSQGHFC